MAVNKVVKSDGTTLIDLSQDTVTSASHILRGHTGHLADGSQVTGAADKAVTYSLTGGASANVTPEKVITGEGLSLKLSVPAGYNLSGVSVTMGGADITSQVFAYDEDSGGSEPNLQAKTNISPTTSSQTITADSGYDGLSSVQINAMPTGTAGTPTATKGTVSNNSISVTPSVTNTTGYITGGTKAGTAVTVSASELVSGSETKTTNGTYDVTNLAELVVNVPTGGGDTNIEIGIANTPIPNILNMFYALENGTATTGEFTLAQSIPSTSTLILDTGLSTVNGLFIADESQAALNTGNTPENTLWAIVFNPGSSTGSYAMTRLNIQMGYGTNTSGVNRGFLNRVSAWEVTNGKLYATGSYNRNNNYTPFYPGHTYRWVAW